MVHRFCIPCTPFSSSKDCHSSAEERYPISQSGSGSHCDASRPFSDRRTYTLVHSYRENPSVSGPYYQRPLATLHGSSLSRHLSHPLPYSNISFAHTFNTRCHFSLQYRILWQSFWHSLRFRWGPHLCHAKHLLEKAVQRGSTRGSRWARYGTSAT